MNAPASVNEPGSPINLRHLTPDQVKAVEQHVKPLTSGIVIASASSVTFAMPVEAALRAVAEAIASEEHPARGYPRQPLQGVYRKLARQFKAGTP